ncbi:MAG: hypothetical protein R2822_17115 [Spirosomataceae bacterium]
MSPLNPGDGKTPYYTSGFNWMLTDYVVEDASYQSLREIIVGYTVPKKYSKNSSKFSAFLCQCPKYALPYCKRLPGLNPEAGFSTGVYNTPLIDGYQRGSYPINKSLRFGVDLSF